MSAKKTYQPQTLYARMLEEIKDWLFQQGYHERALGLREAPGKLIERIRGGFTAAISSTLWQFATPAFEVSAKGVFTEKKEPVTFTFHFCYDPGRVRLELVGMTAQLHEEQIFYKIEHNTRKALPPAATVHAQLKQVRLSKVLEGAKANPRIRPRAKTPATK